MLAGFIGKKAFEQAWGMIDEEEPPDAEHREIHYGKLAAALIPEGAIFRLVRGFFDHGARHGFPNGSPGSWPGEEAPGPE
jgi:hypothetical protein